MSAPFSDGAEPIATAPKDGRVIYVIHDEVGAFHMAWSPEATNWLFAPGETGMWEAPDKSMTWREGEFGPSHWKPLDTCAVCDAIGCDHSDLEFAGIVPPAQHGQGSSEKGV